MTRPASLVRPPMLPLLVLLVCLTAATASSPPAPAAAASLAVGAAKQWRPVVPWTILQRVPEVIQYPVVACNVDVARVRIIARRTARRLVWNLSYLPRYIRARVWLSTPRIDIVSTPTTCVYIVKAYPRQFLRSLYVNPRI